MALGSVKNGQDDLADFLAANPYQAPTVLSGDLNGNGQNTLPSVVPVPMPDVNQSLSSLGLINPSTGAPTTGTPRLSAGTTDNPDPLAAYKDIGRPTVESRQMRLADQDYDALQKKEDEYSQPATSFLGKLGHIFRPSLNAATEPIRARIQQDEEGLRNQDQVDNARNTEQDKLIQEGTPEYQAAKKADLEHTQAETGLENAQTQAALHPRITTPVEAFIQQHPNATAEQIRDFSDKPLDEQTANELEAQTGHKGLFFKGQSQAQAQLAATVAQRQIQNSQNALKITVSQDRAAQAGVAQRDKATTAEAGKFRTGYAKELITAGASQAAAQQAQSLLDSGDLGQAVGVIKTLVSQAGGAGSGVRITQAELSSLAKANGIPGDVDAFFRKVTGTGAISDQEKQQAQALVKATIELQQKKIDILNDGLDSLNNATSVDEVHKADHDLRSKLYPKGSSSGSDMITVQIPGQGPGQIPSSARDKFLKDHPNAKVL